MKRWADRVSSFVCRTCSININYIDVMVKWFLALPLYLKPVLVKTIQDSLDGKVAVVCFATEDSHRFRLSF